MGRIEVISSQTIVSILVPICLGLIMWSLGLNLKVENFKNVARAPRELIIIMAAQLLLIPLLAIGVSWIFNLSPLYAVGLLLLASTPGGPTANYFSHLAGGNVALNITVTAINSLIAIFWVPLGVYVGFKLYMDTSNTIPMQIAKLIQVISVIMVPMLIGMYMNHKNPSLSKRVEKPINTFAIFFLLLLIVGGIAGETGRIGPAVQTLLIPIMLFNLAGIVVGHLVAKFSGLSKASQVSTALELGIHNPGLALGVAISPDLLNNYDIALPSAFYVITVYILNGTYVYYIRRSQPASA